jgi:hypothetical protein
MLSNVLHGNRSYNKSAVFCVIKRVVPYVVADVSARPSAAVLCRPEMEETRTNLWHKITILTSTLIEI